MIAAAQHAALIPSLRYRAALNAYLASGTLAELAPPPGDLAIRYGMYRAQGVDAEVAGVGITLTGLFDNAAKLLLPVVGLGVLVINGVDEATARQLFTIGVLAAGSLLIIVVFLVRSERFTLAFGRLVGKVISGLLVRFGKNPLDDLGPKTVGLRERIGATVRDHWLAASAATLGVHLFNFVILLPAFPIPRRRLRATRLGDPARRARDDRVQFGTLNLDAWALHRNFEIALVLDDADVADRLVERAIDPAIGRAESGFRQGGLDRVRNWFSDKLTYSLERFDHPSVSLPLAW